MLSFPGNLVSSALLPSISVIKFDAGVSFINTHIRSDKGNQLRLRTHMSKHEIEKLRSFDDDDDEN